MRPLSASLAKLSHYVRRYADDLATRLLSTHKRVGIKLTQIQEQLELLVHHVPEWCTMRSDLGQTDRTLFVVTESDRESCVSCDRVAYCTLTLLPFCFYRADIGPYGKNCSIWLRQQEKKLVKSWQKR